MRGVLAYHDLDEALEGIKNKDQKTWTIQIEERSKGIAHDPSTTLEQFVARVFRAEICYCPLVEARIYMHVHISVFKYIVVDLTSMEVNFDDKNLVLLYSLPASFSNFEIPSYTIIIH
jgi:hypothetical protein